MNERIKELAEQAGMTNDKFGMFFAKEKHCEDGVDLQKFTELIIKECISEIHAADVGNLHAKGYYLDKVAEHIENHFGIKE